MATAAVMDPASLAPRGPSGSLYNPYSGTPGPAAADSDGDPISDDDDDDDDDDTETETDGEEEDGGGEGDDSGWWDEDGTYHGGEHALSGEDGYGAGEERMLWTCDVCDVSVNVFARNDHLASRPHKTAWQRLSRSAATAADVAPEQYLPIWDCPVCDEEMSVFVREEHILGKDHQRRVRRQNRQPAAAATTATTAKEADDGDGGVHVTDETTTAASMTLPADALPAPRFASREYTLRTTFYCPPCAAEFPLSAETAHDDDAATWSCASCGDTIHAVSEAAHHDSPRHKILASAPVKDLYCAVCRVFYTQAEKAAHLAGAEHARMVARGALEEQYLARLAALQAPPPQRTQEKKETTCSLCREALMGLTLERHREQFCTAVSRPATTAPSRGPRGGPTVCRLCGEHMGGIGTAAHRLLHCTEITRDPTAPPFPPAAAPAATSNRPGAVSARTNCRLCGEDLGGLTPEAHRQQNCTRVARGPIDVFTPTRRAAPAASTYHCGFCKRGVPMETKAEHVVSKKHLKAVRRKAEIKAAAAAGVEPPKRWRTKKQKRKEEKEKEKVWCAVCQTYKHPAGLEGHLKGRTHREKLAALGQPSPSRPPFEPAPLETEPQETEPQHPTALQPVPTEAWRSSPYITVMGDRFHCSACERDRYLEGVEDHLTSRRHRQKVRLQRQQGA